MLSYEMGSDSFTYNDTFGDLKFKHQQYYLEASSELLDAPEEWFYDVETRTLSLIMPEDDADQCPGGQFNWKIDLNFKQTLRFQLGSLVLHSAKKLNQNLNFQ